MLVELVDRAALGRARLDPALWQSSVTGGWAEFPYLFTTDTAEADLQARMFAPGAGVPEDPATGSAAAAFGGWLGGVIFDLTGSYQMAFLNGIAWNLLNMSIAFWLLAGRPGMTRAAA